MTDIDKELRRARWAHAGAILLIPLALAAVTLMTFSAGHRIGLPLRALLTTLLGAAIGALLGKVERRINGLKYERFRRELDCRWHELEHLSTGVRTQQEKNEKRKIDATSFGYEDTVLDCEAWARMNRVVEARALRILKADALEQKKQILVCEVGDFKPEHDVADVCTEKHSFSASSDEFSVLTWCRRAAIDLARELPNVATITPPKFQCLHAGDLMTVWLQTFVMTDKQPKTEKKETT